jgi:hypothetical protein
MAKRYRIKKYFNTDARVYREGEIHELDEFTARSLKNRGVIGEPIPEDKKRDEASESDTERSSDDTDDYDVDYPEGWFERAADALDSDDGNKMRSVLGELDMAASTKPENKERLQARLEALEEGRINK